MITRLIAIWAFCTTLILATIAAVSDEWREKAVSDHVNRSDYAGRLDAAQLEKLAEAGRKLFTAKFTVHDGVGRPMATQAIFPTLRKRPAVQTFQRMAGLDAGACSSCHNEPVIGGAGDFAANVFVAEGFNNTEFDTTDPQFSNERNTNHLMGAGLVELLAREMTADLHSLRTDALKQARRTKQILEVPLSSKGIGFGSITVHPDGIVDLDSIDGIDPDLVIRPFGQKGVMTSLRQFTINALNHHHGMQAEERFGFRWTGVDDFDDDGVALEISEGDVNALVAWQAARPPPGQARLDDPERQEEIIKGDRIFERLDCTACHIRHLPLDSLVFIDPGPLDAAGTLRDADVDLPSEYDLGLLGWASKLQRDALGRYLIPLFGDLKRHKLTDRQIATLGNELLSQRFVERDVFQTAELWGVGSTAPYGHRGDLTTLDEVILAHGGDARKSRDRYAELSNPERKALIAFLKSLVIE